MKPILHYWAHYTACRGGGSAPAVDFTSPGMSESQDFSLIGVSTQKEIDVTDL